MVEPGVHGEFFMNKVLHGAQSEIEKRPIYVDQHWVRIRIAGMDKDIVERKANDADKARFPDEWARYERGMTQVTSGTPLESWPRMTPSWVANLKGLHIMTVEDMATLSDAGCQKLGMGANDLRKDAQNYLNSAAQASAAQDAERLQGELDLARAEIAELKDLVGKMMEAQAASAVTPPKPKRNGKAVAA